MRGYEYLFEQDFENYIGRRVKITVDAKKKIFEILDLKDKKKIYRHNDKKIETYEGTKEYVKEARKILKQSERAFHFRALEFERDPNKQLYYKEMRTEIPYHLQQYRDLTDQYTDLTIHDMADIARFA